MFGNIKTTMESLIQHLETPRFPEKQAQNTKICPKTKKNNFLLFFLSKTIEHCPK